MRIGKLWLVAILSAIPAAAYAQVNVGVNVGVGVDADYYDTTAPGDPVESVDVFYDQLQPYGVWVDDPDMGRVFIPGENGFVPYTVGHWQYTRLGFVWVSNEPFAWATTHYGRWAYSNAYDRWVWLPDTEWGPAWVEWRQTDADFGWAPLAPVGYSYTPPVESWHYCGAAHILDVNVTRYYEPRDRVVVIHREARPIEHYETVSNVRVHLGPSPTVLREHRIEAKPARVDMKVVGRWAPTEAHAQASRAEQHRATFEVDNQRKLEANTHIRAAQQKVIETHPQLKVKVDARVEAAKTGHAPPPEPNRMQPNRNEQHPPTPMPSRVEPNRNEQHAPTPTRVEPQHAPTPNRVEPQPRPEPTRERPAPAPVEHAPPPARVEPQPRPEPARERPAPAPAPVQHAEPHPAPAPHAEPAHPAPQPAKHDDKREDKKN